MALAKLTIDLEAQLAGLQEGLDKAGFLAERSAAKIESTFAGIGQAFKILSGTLAAGLTISGIEQFFRSTVDGLAKLRELSEATGASVENLSALEDIAVRTGTSVDSAADAVIKLNKALIAGSDPKSDAAAALTAIGLSVENLKQLDPVQALQEVALALNSFADNGAKGRVELVLLGKSTKELAPLLKDLAEAGTLQAKVTAEQAAEAKRFNDALDSMAKNSTDVARAISGPLITALANLFEKLNELRKNRPTWAQLLGAPEEGEVAFDSVQERIKALNKLLESGNLTQERRIRLERQLADLMARPATPIETSFAKTAASWGGGKPSIDDSALGGGNKPPKVPKVRDFSLGPSPISESLQDALRTIEQTDTVKIRKLNDELDRLFELRASGLGGGAEIDEAIKRVIDDLQKLNPAAQAAAEAKKQLDAILEKTPTAELAVALKNVDLINKAFESGIIGVEQWAEAVRIATEPLRKGAEQTKAELSDMAVFANQAARNIQDALGNTLEATLSGHFENIGQLWKDLLIRMASEAAAAQIGKELFGDFGKTGEIGGSVGDLLKFLPALFGSARGNAFAGGVHAFAGGGILGPLGGMLTRPTLFPMANGGIGIGGEAGTEAVMPLKRGRDGKLGVAAQGGGGRALALTYAPTIQIDARSDQAQVAQLVAAGVREGQRQMLEHLRASGVTA